MLQEPLRIARTALTLLILVAPLAAAEGGQPNVVLILADDLGLADVSFYGKERVPTPNIDRIAKEGVAFDQAYVTVPICSPSRAALMTGRYQQRYGFEYNARVDPELPDIGLDLDEVTIADDLKGAGYRTMAVGKWHLGFTDDHYPTERGFDEFFGHLTGATGFIDTSLPQVESLSVSDFERETGAEPGSLPISGLRGGRRGLRQIVKGEQKEPVDNDDEYLTDALARESVAFIERNRERPFFLYAAFNAPHSPFETTKKYYDRFAHLDSRIERVYFGMISALDDAVGSILEALERTGTAENTIVIFLSDNGCAAYYPLLCSCDPVRGGKLTYYEGGVRVPLFVRWPDKIEAGKRSDAPVSSLDILPTALAAAGIEMPDDRELDGVDLLQALASGRGHQTLVWRAAPSVAVRQGGYKMIKPDQNGDEGLLYDLANDPRETKNLFAAEPERVTALEKGLSEWRGITAPAAWSAREPIAYDACGIEPIPFPP